MYDKIMTIEKSGLNVVVFEDDIDTIIEINSQLNQIDAKVVGEASTLPRAFEVLKQLAHRAISADVILLDGNLDYTGERPVFDIRLPVSPDEVAKKGIFGRRKAAKGERVIVDSSDYGVMVRDATVILEIMRRTNIALKVVGISRDKLQPLGLEVDIDLTKGNIDQLAARLSELKR